MTADRRTFAVTKLVAIGALLGLAGWGLLGGGDNPVERFVAADGPVYSTGEELTDVSDVAVIGTVLGVQSRYVDNGGDPANDPFALAHVRFNVEVEEWLKGDGASTIVVDTIDLTGVEAHGTTSLAEGERVALFLKALTHDDVPHAVSEGDTVYVVSGSDDGVFDIVGSEVFARSAEFEALSENPESPARKPDDDGGNTADGTVSELRDVVQEAQRSE